ncbi:LysR family transcriptional regulator [Acerihabitans arboris]|uniref:LysR family transcriptional regulator n=1 Tax=Acerihabitans arboris TaxID=2691583 RepID=A0A845SKY6_9GAMM|nr:LysR family transcriptional regulator [Acerihabitans arboris]NDL63271.1 LysR family transcriptional regulator [Acerihabitans arboris]
MKIHLINEFIVLSQVLNFSKTAQMMNVTQPVLSRHIKYLEDRLGVALLRRDTHKVELTTAGKLFAGEARKIITQYESSLAVMHAFCGKGRHRLAIAFLGEAIHSFLISFLNRFHQSHGDIAVECRDSELDEALALLDSHICDFGFLIRPNFMAHDPRFSTLSFQTDPLCVAFNKQHPLADRARVTLREIGDWPIIRVDPQAFALSEAYSTQFLTGHGVEFALAREYPNLKTCCFNLEFNKQAALLMPRHRGYLLGDNCVLVDIAEEDCWFNLELVWDNKNANPGMGIFLREFKNFIQ